MTEIPGTRGFGACTKRTEKSVLRERTVPGTKNLSWDRPRTPCEKTTTQPSSAKPPNHRPALRREFCVPLRNKSRKRFSGRSRFRAPFFLYLSDRPWRASLISETGSRGRVFFLLLPFSSPTFPLLWRISTNFHYPSKSHSRRSPPRCASRALPWSYGSEHVS